MNDETNLNTISFLLFLFIFIFRSSENPFKWAYILVKKYEDLVFFLFFIKKKGIKEKNKNRDYVFILENKINFKSC